MPDAPMQGARHVYAIDQQDAGLAISYCREKVILMAAEIDIPRGGDNFPFYRAMRGLTDKFRTVLSPMSAAVVCGMLSGEVRPRCAQIDLRRALSHIDTYADLPEERRRLDRWGA
jgi:hypothetical protein